MSNATSSSPHNLTVRTRFTPTNVTNARERRFISNIQDGEHAAFGVCTGISTLISLYMFFYVCGSRVDKIDNMTLRATSYVLKKIGVTSSKSCIGSFVVLLVSGFVHLMLVTPLILCLLWGGLTVENDNKVISGLCLLTLFPSLGIIFVSALTWQK